MSTRISHNQIFRNAQGNVSAAREKETASSEKASTGKEITRPSQNPSGYLIAADLKDDLSVKDTIAKNASLAMHVLNRNEDILSQIQESTQRAHELSLSTSAENAASLGSRKAVLGEIRTLYDGILQAANSKFGNRTLLAGFHSQGPAFNKEGKYLGDKGSIEIEIARGLKVPVNVSGERALLGTGVKGGTNILSTFRQLIKGLEEDNSEMIQGTLSELMKANEQLSTVRGEVGARMNQLNRSLESLQTGRIESMESISQIEDADAIKVFSDLARDQTVLKAAISTSQKLLSDNPADILFK